MMDASTDRAAAILFLELLLIIVTISLSSCHGKLNGAGCVETEKQALLKFKQGLQDDSNRLSSWDVEEDCWKWAGVICDNVTGHVRQLHLQNPYSYYKASADSAEFKAYQNSMLHGELDPSLLKLRNLGYLNLSGNNFQGIPVPDFLGSLRGLQYLDLSRAGFVGTVPHQLGNLSSLRFLSLEGLYLSPGFELQIENLDWLSGLSNLEHLELGRVNLGKATNWLQVINMLPSLVELHLKSCQLDYINPLLPNVNFTSLLVLDLSNNHFTSSIPGWIFSLGSLQSLNLATNDFGGPIPSHQNMTNLRVLDLSFNSLNSSIPNGLYSFRHLEFLNLRRNQLQGTISSSIGNLTSVVSLDLSFNELVEQVPIEVGMLCNLRHLFLSHNKFGGDALILFGSLSECVSHTLESLELHVNQFSGHLNDQLGLFKSLQTFSLQHNSISGSLPESLGHLARLVNFDASYNFLEGVVSEVHFSNLTSLRSFHASGNQLVLKVGPNWIPPFQLSEMYLTSWRLGPQFPLWLHSQKNLWALDLSSTGISDKIPNWFWNLSSNFYYLNLSHNQLQGEIQENIVKINVFLSAIYLSSNNFSGPLPRISSNVDELDLSNNTFSGDIFSFLCDKKDERNNLKILHLGRTFLSGEIPDCWMNWPLLRVINLGNNHLSGSIPSSLGELKQLRSLHLRNNNFTGKIPLSLLNCRELVVIDLSWNRFVGSIPMWLGKSLSQLMMLNLRSNRFSGKIPSGLCYLASLQILDLANNSFFGSIPQCFKNFTALTVKRNSSDRIFYSLYLGAVLEEAQVVTKGREVQYDTILPLVTNMDLSDNNISGEIPGELTSLFGLQSLNLSGNHLTGLIPEGIGDMDSLESLDLSRNQLSGEIPPSMSALSFLSHLNVSYNDLWGKIPLSTQLQSLDPSSFIGNHLCGVPLLVNCSPSTESPDAGTVVEEGKQLEIDWFYVSMALGFVVGFWGVIGPLLFNRFWRYVYFQFLDNIGLKLWLYWKLL